MLRELFECHGLPLAELTEGNKNLVRRMGLDKYADSTAFCVTFDDRKPLTFFAEGLPPEEQEFVLAHELGHIFMGHLTERRNCSSDEAERMANIFGAVMLALSLYDEYKKLEEVQSHG